MQATISGLVGKTPVLSISGGLFLKLEYFNPAGSVKDRAVKFMLEEGEKSGKLKKGSTVIEPTSGNTGIALAALCAAKGIRAVIVMPENFSIERRKIILSYGAKVILTDKTAGMRGAIEKAEKLQKTTANSAILGQFDNPANPLAHYKTTAPEIWEDMRGKVDIFVAGVGTGGTVTGCGRYFKEKNPAIKIVAVQPKNPPPHKIQGIGAGFVPKNFDLSVVDEIFPVADEEAISAARELARNFGIFGGVSSGAAYFAAAKILNRTENSGKNVVALLPDGGERYLSDWD